MVGWSWGEWSAGVSAELAGSAAQPLPVTMEHGNDSTWQIEHRLIPNWGRGERKFQRHTEAPVASELIDSKLTRYLGVG